MAKVKISKRLQGINAFHVMSLMAEAKQLDAQGHQVIHMEMGEPDFSTPQPIIDAGIAALRSGITHYTPTLGLPALREAIASFYLKEHRVSVDPEQIVITPGSATALQLGRVRSQGFCRWIGFVVNSMATFPVQPKPIESLYNKALASLSGIKYRAGIS